MALNQFNLQATQEFNDAAPGVSPRGALDLAAAAPLGSTPEAQAYFAQNPDVASAFAQNNFGLDPDAFARTHFDRFGRNEQRVWGLPAPAPAPAPAFTSEPEPYYSPSGPEPDYFQSVAPRIPAPAPLPMQSGLGSTQEARDYFAQNPDVERAFIENAADGRAFGLDPDAFARAHFERFGRDEQRVWGAPAPAPAPAPAAIDTSDPRSLIKNIITGSPEAATNLALSRAQAYEQGEASSFNDPGMQFGNYTVRQLPGLYDWTGAYTQGGYEARSTESAPDTDQLRSIGLAGRPVETTITYDSSGNMTGAEKRFFKGGDSGIVYRIDAEGNLIDASEFDYSEEWKGAITPLVQMVTMALAPYLGTIGGALSGGALSGAAASGLGGAVVGGAGAALTGQDVLKGAALGGLGAAGGQLAQGLGQAASTALGGGVLGDIAAGAIRGAAGALPSAIITEDVDKLVAGALSGGVGAGTRIALSELGIPLTGAQIAQGMNFLKAVQSDDIMGAVNAAAQLEGSQNSKVAAAALGVASAVRAGSPQAIIAAMMGLNEALQKPVDPAEAAFNRAKQAGASDAEAAAAARAVTGGDAIDRATAAATGVPVTQMPIPEVKILGEPGAGGADLVITNQEADTPEEAAALAQSRGVNSFTFGGNKYELNARQEVQRLFDDYAKSKNKSVDQLSANEVNSFFDKVNPYIINDSFTVLKGASLQDVLSGNVSTKPMEMKDAGYVDEEGRYRVNITGVGSTGVVPEDPAQGLIDWANSVGGTKGEVVRQTMSTIFGLAGEQIADLGTALANMNLVDRYNAMVKFGEWLEQTGNKLEIPGVTEATKNFIKSIEDEPTYSGKLAAGLKAIYEKPLVVVQGAKEVGQEVLPILAGVGAARLGGKLLGVATDVLLNSAESMGSQSRQTYREEIEAGKSPQEAAKIANRKGFIAGAITAGMAGVADASVLKMYEKVTDKVLGRSLSAAGKEFGEEGGEELLISLATGDDLATALTKSVVGSFVGAKASGSVQAAANIQSDLAAAFAEEGYTSTDGTFSPASLVKVGQGPGTSNVSGNTVTASGPGGQTTNITVTNNDLTSGSLSNNVSTAVNNGTDAATVVSNVANAAANSGTDVNAVTNAAVNAANSAGATVNVAGNTVSSTQTKNDVTTNTTVDNNTGVTNSTSVNNTTGETTNTTSDANTSQSTTQSGTTASTTTTDNNTGSSVTNSVNQSTGVVSQTTTDASSGVTTKTETDTNTNTTTQTQTDANTGITTTTQTNPNTNVTTTTNTNSNTGITTQVTVDQNTGVTTQVTSNPNTGVQTTTTTDTNTETTTTVDTNTNTQTTVVVNAQTGEIISYEEGSVTGATTPPTSVGSPTSAGPIKTTAPVAQVAPAAQAAPAPSGGGMMLSGAASGAAMAGLAPQFLRSFETQGYIDPLAKVKEAQAELQSEDFMQQLDPRLAAILQERMGQQQPEQDSIGALSRMLSGEPEPANNPYYSYGQEESIDDILGGRAMGFAQGGYVAPLQMADGGMSLPLLAKEGGHAREDFRDGKHVAGDGDGQSDDIPAWLADGEFVFPADVVSALGNGSTKAGTDKLYEMMHEIRKRARSTDHEDLPPPALKSPLDYLKSKR